MSTYQPIGVFDSGYGGLTILKEIVKKLPQYDYIYLGDNARTPYGTRSFEIVYHYTLECVEHLFGQGCRLVILACNTASAKALRNIQQLDLPRINGVPGAGSHRVLGVIRPTTEVIGQYSRTGHVGILATTGTVTSESYRVEISKFFPDLRVEQEACPMWVPLVENNEFAGAGADYFVRKHLNALLQRAPQTDTLLLACTHYPLLLPKIRQFTPDPVTLLSQGTIVANSLANYLQRHADMAAQCSQLGTLRFFTTDTAETFSQQASVFWGGAVTAEKLNL